MTTTHKAGVTMLLGAVAIARMCHEANREYCMSIGDFSQPEWEMAPNWQKASAISGVEMIMQDPNTTPEQSHEGWLRVKQEDGWKYGPVKDPEKKEHPCFVPYAELPEAQRQKDHIFGSIVRSFMILPVEAVPKGRPATQSEISVRQNLISVIVGAATAERRAIDAEGIRDAATVLETYVMTGV